jgi:hypothetical protein
MAQTRASVAVNIFVHLRFTRIELTLGPSRKLDLTTARQTPTTDHSHKSSSLLKTPARAFCFYRIRPIRVYGA